MLSSGHEFDSCRHVESERRSLSSRTESASDAPEELQTFIHTDQLIAVIDRRLDSRLKNSFIDPLLILDLTSEIISGSLSGKVTDEVQTSQVK